MIRAIISAVSFYFFPTLTGRAIILLLHRNGKRRFFSVIDYFTVGSLVLFSLTLFIYLLSSVLFVASFAKVLPVVLRSLFAILIIFNLSAVNSLRLSLKKNKGALIWILAVGMAIYSLWRWNTAYPFPLNWDFFHHQTLVNQIKVGQLSFLLSHISDTFRFNGYSPLFHLLLAWPQLIFKPDVLAFFWWLEFFHLLTALSAVYFLAKKLLKTQIAAVTATIFSGLIFESYMIYASLFLIPQTLTAVVFAFLIGKFLFSKFSPKRYWINFLFLFFLHYLIGTVAVGILLFITWLSSKRNWFESRKTYGMAICAALVLILLFAQVSLPVNLDFLNRGEAAVYNYTIGEKIEFFKIFSGNILFSFFLLGIIATLLKRGPSLKILLSATLMLIFLIALPFPYVFKFYVLAHYPVSLFATIGFLFLFNRLKIKLLQISTLSVCISVMLILFISSAGFIKNTLKQQNSNALVSWQEIQAAEFLKRHYANKYTFLVSDPATQQILEPLAGTNTQGGAYSDEKTREVLSQINQLSNSDEIRLKLLKIQDKVINKKPDIVLFVLSGRYFRWQEATPKEKKDLSFNVWRPTDLSLKNLKFTESLAKSGVFQEVFRNKSMAIFQTSPSLINL